MDGSEWKCHQPVRIRQRVRIQFFKGLAAFALGLLAAVGVGASDWGHPALLFVLVAAPMIYLSYFITCPRCGEQLDAVRGFMRLGTSKEPNYCSHCGVSLDEEL